LQLLYLDELLELVKRKFCEQFKERLKSINATIGETFEFTDMFLKIMNSIEEKSERKKKDRAEKGPRKFEHTDKGKQSKLCSLFQVKR
jgi:hypothetical protein